MQNNITIKKAEITKTASELDYKQSKNNKLPSVAGSASLSLLNGSSVDPVTSDFVSNLTTSNSFSASSSMTLYQGNKLNLNIERSKILVDQNELYVQEAENNISLSIIEAYLQALYYYEGISVAENTAASRAEELRQAQFKYKNGAIAKLELAEVETQKANNDYDIFAAKNQYQQQVLVLKQLLELPSTIIFQKITKMRAVPELV